MVIKHAGKLILLDAENNALVLRRSDTHPHIPLTSDLPGGEFENGESPAAAVCRETFEETGIRLQESDIKEVGKRQLVAFGREYDLHLFVAHVTNRPEVTISWEHNQYKWVPLENVDDLDDGYQPLVAEFVQRNRT